MKAMTIGISPQYNYPGNLAEWLKDNTYYASNFGGSLITRAIMKEFGADYIDDFSDFAGLKNKYDTCILAFATHAHTRRNVSKYADLVEKLQMKTIVVSLGVADFLSSATPSYRLHESVRRVLDVASDSSNWIGVRGPYTAFILNKNGYKNVVPVGCPTVYWNMKPDFDIPGLKTEYTRPLVVYHKTIAAANFDLVQQVPLLGQDYQDEAIFSDKLSADRALCDGENAYYERIPGKQHVLQAIREHGLFPDSFEDWFGTIGSHDFVFGPRLHGCIAALIQGVPAIMTPRDLRVREIVEVFNLPSIDYRDIAGKKIGDVYSKAKFEKFQQTYTMRYKNYMAFISENELASNLEPVDDNAFHVLHSDYRTSAFLTNYQLGAMEPATQNTIRHRIKRFLARTRRSLKFTEKR